MSSSEMATRVFLECTSLLVLLLTSFFFLCSSAADTISFGQSLSGNQTIVSKQGYFELGFFTPGTSQNYYVGIWYKNIQVQTVVWVANRETPLSNPTTAELKISENGSLVLVNQSKIPIWSSKPNPRPSNSTIAVLLDTGNLVLRNGSAPDSSDVLWQSFDYPTDTVLPGAKIGYNRTSGKNWILTSWRNSEDPAPGNYTLLIDPSGVSQYFMLWNRTHQYWSSGAWDGRIFSLVPEVRLMQEYKFNHFTSVNADYFTYSDSEKFGISGMFIDLNGQLSWHKWSYSPPSWVLFTLLPKNPCDVYFRCGSFGICTPYTSPPCGCLSGFVPRSSRHWESGDNTKGCVRRTPLRCSNNDSTDGEKDGFLMVYNVRLPENSMSLVVKSAEECESVCLKDCLCTSYSYNSGCLVWKEDLMNLKQFSGDGGGSDVLHLRMASSELRGSKKRKHISVKVVLVIIVAIVILMCAITVMISRIRKKRLNRRNSIIQGFPVPYRYKDLQNATKNFSEKLGKGGFGSVYKGTLRDSSVVAVKKFEGLGQGDKQFRMEVSSMAAIQHVNIVQLLGFCCEGTTRLLVYDYMPNGSLDAYLFPKDSGSLDWSSRFQIAIGVARGLAYLHERCRECIIHCDIKPENILLDANFCPKVADFGMAKLVGRDFSRVLTTMRGTIGYLAPEWISGVPITPKADVYSFGMMLFEIVSGRRNGRESEDGDDVFFPIWAARNVSEAEVPNLEECDGFKSHTNMEEFRRTCRVACWCIQDNEDHRPSMGQVVQMLEVLLDLGVPPIPRYLQNLVENEDDIFFKLELHSLTNS